MNAAAGGGTLLSFPALLLSGLTPLQANATSSVGLQAGLLTAVFAYRRELRELRTDALRLLAPCVLGGSLGAVLALRIGGRAFAIVAPLLLLLGAVLIVAQPILGALVLRLRLRDAALTDAADRVTTEGRTDGTTARASGRAAAPGSERATARAGPHPLVFTAGTFLLAIYCGYFGAGGGILFLAALGLLLPRPFGELNALKVLALPASNGVGALTFVVLELWRPTGVIAWGSVPPLAVGALAGGVLGVRVAKKLPGPALRWISAAIGVGIALYLVVR